MELEEPQSVPGLQGKNDGTSAYTSHRTDSDAWFPLQHCSLCPTFFFFLRILELGFAGNSDLDVLRDATVDRILSPAKDWWYVFEKSKKNQTACY